MITNVLMITYWSKQSHDPVVTIEIELVDTKQVVGNTDQ